ncbi:hypothetical protein CORC01_06679 [Colletotrichum orchidophilum]|uniref:Uncharacterized protein n=1 Tax=Colletotrichum orchidophilum TaxID=1209926 RepID=A0A1G4B9B6_9PEZI|nr:uncharacterized protein CORC01_06679 [Colletotrichum orchidophilum]OHE98010.1 hypothetical protein CORC01_06679 [Colletotrichum orchidophilum]
MNCNETRQSSRKKGLSESKSDPSLLCSSRSSRGNSSQSDGLSSLESRVTIDSLITSTPSESSPPGRAHQSARCRSLYGAHKSNDEGGRQSEQKVDPAPSGHDLVSRGFSGKGPSQRDFEADPAHGYWSWSSQSESWYHVDESTGAVLWVPHQLD